jgi:hypothetical protein
MGKLRQTRSAPKASPISEGAVDVKGLLFANAGSSPFSIERGWRQHLTNATADEFL